MRKPFFRGDTLIEVVIAVGIFSLVAVSVVAVMNVSTSNIQTSLEDTMARNEIDAQAEALRFIHDAYEAEKDLDSNEQTYSKIWATITDLADKNNGIEISEFTPATCMELYDKESSSYIFSQNAFIIDLALLTDNKNTNINALRRDASYFEASQLYPRIFGSDDDLNLLDDSNDNFKAQGIFIIPIADSGTEMAKEGGGTETRIAYYDFYIRTCWSASGSDSPSTISTVIRLYNPDVEVVDEQFSYTPPETVIYYSDMGGENVYCLVTNNIPDVFSQDDCYNRGMNTEDFDSMPQSEDEDYAFRNWQSQDGSKQYGVNDRISDIKDKNDTVDNFYVYPNFVQRRMIRYHSTTDQGEDNIICKDRASKEETFNGSSSTFQIKNLSDDCLSSIVGDDGKVFQGWSTTPDGSDGIRYVGSFDSIEGGAKTILNEVELSGNNYILDLYPIWRTKVIFSGWTSVQDDDQAETMSKSCGIFNIEPPSDSTAYSRSVAKGGTYGSMRNPEKYNGSNFGYNTATMDGYEVSSLVGKHIETFTQDDGKLGVNLQGFCDVEAKNIGVSYTIDVEDTFELSAKINTNGIIAHPVGYAAITIGDLSLRLKQESAVPYCGTTAQKEISYSADADGYVYFALTKYGDTYSFAFMKDDGSGNLVATNQITCSGSAGAEQKVSFTMYHKSHGCGRVFNVQIEDILMTQFHGDQ